MRPPRAAAERVDCQLPNSRLSRMSMQFCVNLQATEGKRSPIHETTAQADMQQERFACHDALWSRWSFLKRNREALQLKYRSKERHFPSELAQALPVAPMCSGCNRRVMEDMIPECVSWACAYV